MKLALTPIVERLRGAVAGKVEGCLEFAGQTAEPRQLPYHAVVPMEEAPGSNTADVARDQLVDVTFAVFVVVDGARRNREGVSEEIRKCTEAVKDAIVGWTHPEASRACAYAGGRLASASGSTAVWQLRFRARYHIRKAS